MTSYPKRLATRFSNSTENVWVKFNRCATEHSEVNLGQGQPDYSPSEWFQKTLADVALGDSDYQQYTREQGHPRLVEAISALHSPLLGKTINPMNEIIVTHGACESLGVSFLSLVNPGDEVILIEPFYDCCKAMTEMAGGVPVYVPLKPSVEPPTKSSDWILDPAELEAKFNDKTKLIVLTNPNNPIGKLFTREELELIASLCIKHDVICISDEVYEWVVFPGKEHIRIATLPGMWERTITISSASKSFGLSGWRVGWSIGPKELIDCLMIAHQNGDCFCTTPAQEAMARCIEEEAGRLNQSDSFFTQQREALQSKCSALVEMLNQAGFKSCVPDSGHFVLADWTSIATNEIIEDGSGDPSDFKFVMWLIKEHKIASIPPSAFYGKNKAIVEKYARFCFFKSDELLNKAKKYFDAIKK